MTAPDLLTRALTAEGPTPLGDGIRARLRDRLISGIASVADSMPGAITSWSRPT